MTFIFGILGLLYQVIPKQIRSINYYFMSLKGYEPNEDKFTHSILSYRLTGALFIILAVLSYFQVIDLSSIMED